MCCHKRRGPVLALLPVELPIIARHGPEWPDLKWCSKPHRRRVVCVTRSGLRTHNGGAHVGKFSAKLNVRRGESVSDRRFRQARSRRPLIHVLRSLSKALRSRRLHSVRLSWEYVTKRGVCLSCRLREHRLGVDPVATATARATGHAVVRHGSRRVHLRRAWPWTAGCASDGDRSRAARRVNADRNRSGPSSLRN